MNVVSQGLRWIGFLLGWAFVIWLAVGLLVGSIMIALDERRLHRMKPKPEEVRAHAADLVARYGQDAFRLNGEAMYKARLAKDFHRYRFLKEVSGELISRVLSERDASRSGVSPC